MPGIHSRWVKAIRGASSAARTYLADQQRMQELMAQAMPWPHSCRACKQQATMSGGHSNMHRGCAKGTYHQLKPLKCGSQCRIIYTPSDNRSSWAVLEKQAIELIRSVSTRLGDERRVILVAESFGGCLGVRVARSAPHLLERLVLINPATSFTKSLGGITALVAATNLLSIFPERLYQARPCWMCRFGSRIGPTGFADSGA